MRICLVSNEYPPAGTGGIAAYVYVLAHGLAAAGQEVTVIAGAAHKPVASGQRLVTRNGVGHWPLLAAPRSSLSSAGVIRRQGRGIRTILERSWVVDRTIASLEHTQGPFDVVEMPNWGAEAIFYSIHPRAPLVIRLSTPLALVDQFKARSATRVGFRLHCYLEGLPARRAACTIAHSRFITNYCANLYRIPAATSYLIPLGITAPPVPATKSAADKVVTILFVGRLERRKGIDYLLQAIPRVTRSVPHVKFVIAGLDTGDAPQGMTYQDYFASFATRAARQATTFLGYVEDRALAQLYADCDVFVAPSLSESFGLIYLEAMVRAKPVIAFRTGAAPEVIEHGKTGILVALNNKTELANALIKLAEDMDMRQEMGRRGYDRARAEFSAQRMIAATLACYRQIKARL